MRRSYSHRVTAPNCLPKIAMVVFILMFAIWTSACSGSTANIPIQPSSAHTDTEASCPKYDLLVLGTPFYGKTRNSSYYLICANGPAMQFVMPSSNGKCYYQSPTVSLSKSLVAYACDKALSVFDLSGEIVDEIDVGDWVISPSWSPDGEYIGYIVDQQDLEIVHVPSGLISKSLFPQDFEYPLINSPLEPGIVALIWSPHGDQIAFLTTYQDLYVLDVSCNHDTQNCSTGNFSQLASYSISIKAISEFSWSPDGTKLVVVCDPDPGPDGSYENLCILSVKGEVLMTLSGTELSQNIEGLASPMWSPDGNKIAFLTFEGLWLLSLQDYSLRNLSKGLLATDSAIAWLP